MLSTSQTSLSRHLEARSEAAQMTSETPENTSWHYLWQEEPEAKSFIAQEKQRSVFAWGMGGALWGDFRPQDPAGPWPGASWGFVPSERDARDKTQLCDWVCMGPCKALREVDVIAVWAFFMLLGDLEQESARIWMWSRRSFVPRQPREPCLCSLCKDRPEALRDW